MTSVLLLQTPQEDVVLGDPFEDLQEVYLETVALREPDASAHTHDDATRLVETWAEAREALGDPAGDEVLMRALDALDMRLHEAAPLLEEAEAAEAGRAALREILPLIVAVRAHYDTVQFEAGVEQAADVREVLALMLEAQHGQALPEEQEARLAALLFRADRLWEVAEFADFDPGAFDMGDIEAKTRKRLRQQEIPGLEALDAALKSGDLALLELSAQALRPHFFRHFGLFGDYTTELEAPEVFRAARIIAAAEAVEAATPPGVEVQGPEGEIADYDEPSEAEEVEVKEGAVELVEQAVAPATGEPVEDAAE